MPHLLLTTRPHGQAPECALMDPDGDAGLALPMEESKIRAGRGNWASERCLDAGAEPFGKAELIEDRRKMPKSAGSAPVDDHSTGRPASGQELSKLGLGRGMQVELRTLQLPVDYREVEQRVMRIWEDLQPQLTVHVGLDSAAKAVVLEQCGKNRGYREADVRGFRPEQGTCLPGGPEVIESRVNMKAVSRRAAVEGVEVAFSRDAGRYVCDYTYYLSLHHGNGCAALIHVPPLSLWLPASLLGKALRVIIQEMLEQDKEAPAPSLVHRNVDLGGSSPGEAIGGLLL